MPTNRSRRTSGPARTALVLLACLAVVGSVFVLFHRGVGPLPNPESCQARVGGVVVDLSTDQVVQLLSREALAG